MKRYLLITTLLLSSILFAVEYDDGYLLETPDSYYDRLEYLSSLEKIEFIRGEVVKERHVFISWIPIGETSVTYTIYRNRRLMDTYMAFENAVVVGEVIDKDSFLDSTISESGTYYYAVTTKKSGYAEDRNLKRNRSYLNRGFTINTGKSRSTVFSLTAQKYSDGIFLRWRNPFEYTGNLFVYRSLSIIDSREALSSAVMIKKLSRSEQYRDRSGTTQNFYYAVLIEGRDNRPERIFNPNNNFTGYRARRGSKPSASVNTLSIKTFLSERGAEIRWNIPEDRQSEAFLLYKSSTVPRTVKDVLRGTLIKKIDSGTNSYYDRDGVSGYCYSIISRSSTDSRRRLENGVDFAILSNEGKSGRSSVGAAIATDAIDKLVREFYQSKNYAAIVNSLLLIAKRTTSVHERAKAYYFAGRISAESGKYRNALKYLYRNDVQKHYRDESKFWQDYCLTNLK